MWRSLARGMGTTLRLFFQRKATIPYPEKKKRRSARFRGRHELRRYANGLEMCIGCELCQVACPANAIRVYGAENDPAAPHSPGERYAYRYEVDMLRCIFCGLCEEACPTDALHLTQAYELADFSRASLVYGRDRLLQEKGSHPLPPGVYQRYEGLQPSGKAIFRDAADAAEAPPGAGQPDAPADPLHDAGQRAAGGAS